MLGRVQAAALCVVLAVGLAPQAARGDPALTYLESLKGSSERYKAPSELDERYTVALYVNAAGSGPWRQRMWVLHRDAIGGPWRLAMWDKEHWRKAKLPEGAAPSYSWPVSTGRYYRGDPFSGRHRPASLRSMSANGATAAAPPAPAWCTPCISTFITTTAAARA
jgi:hypothetical protein